MSLNTETDVNKAEPIGKTIAHANARLITTEEAKQVGGGKLLPWPWVGATSSACVSYGGADYEGRDE